ncbi:MAG: hypothetical protein LC799_04160 [Actinobacteria bacterium]|nr:hypothetical protein [Actinomycetota bacterium]
MTACVQEITTEVRRLTALSFDLARAYADPCGGQVKRLAPLAFRLDAELSELLEGMERLPGPCPTELRTRCEVARQALSHLVAAPRLLAAGSGRYLH